MKKTFAKWILTLLVFSFSGLVSCGGTGLGVAALLGGGTTGSGEGGLNGAFADASASATDDDADSADDELSHDATVTTYYIDENGVMVEVSVDVSSDATAYANETVPGANGVDGDPTTTDAVWNESEGASGTGTDADPAAGSNMTDERSEFGETELGDITLENLPVTIAKDTADGSEGEGEESNSDCTSENRQTVSLVYGSGEERYMMMPEEDGGDDRSARRSRTRSGGRSGLKGELLRQTGDDDLALEAIVFFPNADLWEDEGADVTPVKCEAEGPEITHGDIADTRGGAAETAGSYAWQSMSGEGLSGYEVETGTLRARGGRLELGERATSLNFVGGQAGFRLNADDFGMAPLEDGESVIPYIILRPR